MDVDLRGRQSVVPAESEKHVLELAVGPGPPRWKPSWQPEHLRLPDGTSELGWCCFPPQVRDRPCGRRHGNALNLDRLFTRQRWTAVNPNVRSPCPACAARDRNVDRPAVGIEQT